MARIKENPTLDQLLSPSQPVSDPIEVEIGTQKVTIAFKALSREDITDAEIAAQRRVLLQLRDEDMPDDHLSNPLMLQAIENETELELLAASMVNPESPSGRAPAFSMQALRQAIQPAQQERLNEQWWVWQTKWEPEKWSEDPEEFGRVCTEIVDAAKKKDWVTLTKYGSNMLMYCLGSLVKDLSDSQIAKSLDGSYTIGQSGNGVMTTELLTKISDLEARFDSLEEFMGLESEPVDPEKESIA